MKLLKRNVRGPLVRRWQLFLLGQGLNPGPLDGIFGQQSIKATKKFQKLHDLQADGIVGNRTWAQALLLGFTLVDNPDNTAKSGPNYPPKPSFRPLSGTAARQRKFGKFSFVSDPSPRNRERIRITDNWERENIIRVHIPQLAGVEGAPRSGKVRFHRLAAPQLVALWQAWEDAGLLPLVLTWAGTFVPRFIRGSRTSLSNHAFGTAFDINVAWNRLGTVPALVGQKGSVRELVPLAHKYGFYWGGHFRRQDGMHFEVAIIQSTPGES